ncbi:MAG: homoserine dehydrogenase [Thermovirgaceae bacterium]
MRILLLGFGNVGKAFCELFAERRPWLRSRFGIEGEIVGIGTRTRGCLYDPSGLSLEDVLRYEASTGHLDSGMDRKSFRSAKDLLELADYDMLVECTTTNIAQPKAAFEFMRTAIDRGAAVVTSNKGPLFLSYRQLEELARKRGVPFLFEATVLAGTPFFSFVRHCLQGTRILSCEGVVNGTCNYILDLMAQGSSFDEALLDARRKGYAEPEPFFDVEGTDSAVKAAIIAQVLMGAPPVSLEDVHVEGIRSVSGAMIRKARRSGGNVRLVARVEAAGKEARITVKPEVLPGSHPLSNVNGAANGVLFVTDALGDVFVAGGGTGPKQTAFALYRDVVEAAADGDCPMGYLF